MNSNRLQNLGGFSIGRSLFSIIREKLPGGNTILEFGSGFGTECLSEYYKVISIENEKEWIGKYNSSYIYAPLVNGWYDPLAISSQLKKDLLYKLILIDGPCALAGDRRLLLNHMALFNWNCLVILDDIERSRERELFDKLCAYLKRDNDILDDNGKKFGVIYYP